MNKSNRGSWRGLYALVLFTIALLYATAVLKVGHSLRLILLLAVIALVGFLTSAWSERHASLMASEGVNAWAEQDRQSIEALSAGPFAYSLTVRQFHYRMVLAGDSDRSQGWNDELAQST